MTIILVAIGILMAGLLTLGILLRAILTIYQTAEELSEDWT
jgi:hypothetical protein